MIRVIVADDHDLVRQGIIALLERADDIEVVGEARDGLEAANMADRLNPDVAVLDISMPNMTGIQATERIRRRHADTNVVILSMYDDETLIKQSLDYGASAYVMKGSVVEELLLAVRVAGVGGTYFSPAISRSTLGELLHRSPPSSDLTGYGSLTTREREILKLVAEGVINRKVAEKLVISVKTVEKDRANLMSKLGIHDLAGLVRVAIKEHLIFLDG